MTIFTGIVAYFLLTTPLALLLGQAPKANRRRYPALQRKDRQ
jgi:phage terminase Nu1 subunit (DNA packaging protein)